MTIIQFPSSSNEPGAANPPPPTLVLPVAQRSFCRIRFDSPEALARAVPPAGALNWLDEHLRQGADIRSAVIEGPGDPLCEIDDTFATLRLVRDKYPDIAFGLTTLGLNGGEHAATLAAAGVKEVTLLVDAVRPEVAGNLYTWIRPGKKTVPLAEACSQLVDEQQQAVKAFRKAGCRITVRSSVYPGVNDDHIEEIAAAMAACGADAMMVVPCKSGPAQDAPPIEAPVKATLQHLRESAAQHIAVLETPAKENRLGEDCPSPLGVCASFAQLPSKPTRAKPNIAVVSSNGMEVDLHLGQAYQVLIYGPREDGLTCLLGTRPVPEPGSGSSRWEELAATLTDCFAVLAASAGESPRRILDNHAIAVLITDGEIEGTVDLLYGGGKKRKKGKR